MKFTYPKLNGGILFTSLLAFVSIQPATSQTNYSEPYTGSNFVKTIDLSRPVGTINAEAGVTPAGASTYTIPIYAPPGTNGMMPSISLVYNSQAGSGVAGYGWGISGLSLISRSGKDIYHDGKVAPAELGLDDPFVLDGMRLNLIDGNGNTGSIYATENESFSKIVKEEGDLVNPGWFSVQTKDGTILEFGHTADSKIMSDDGQYVMLLRLNRMKDINGNYIDFIYDNSNRDSRIDEINYTGNANAGLLPYNKIKFTYGNRQDNNTMYDAGSSFNSFYLLNKITVTHLNDNNVTETVKTYNLRYAFDNVYSLLKEIEECGAVTPIEILPLDKEAKIDPAVPECLNTTIFLYGEASTNIDVIQGNNLIGEYSYFTGDFDADGKSDLLAVQSYFDPNIEPYGMRFDIRYKLVRGTDGNDIIYSRELPQGAVIDKNDKRFFNFLTADYNKDGRDDIVEMNISWSTQYLKRQLNTVTINHSLQSSYNPVSFAVPTGGYNLIHSSGNYFIPGDFDGDGNQDYILILGKWLSGTTFDYKAFLTRPSAGEINIPVIGLGDGMPTYPDEGVAGVASSAFVNPIDMDGDGKMEILVTTNPTYGYSSSYLFKITKNGNVYNAFYDYAYNPISDVTEDSKVFPGDFNGDRKTDLLVRNSDGSWKIMTSNGRSFAASQFNFNQAVVMNNTINHKIVVSDFNGDGKSDILHGISNGFGQSSLLSFYYNKGNGLWRNDTLTYNNRIPSVQSTASNGFAGGDFDGDGHTDLMNIIDIWTTADIIKVKPGTQDRLLKKVTNGHNSTTTFEYKNLTDKTGWPYVYNRTIFPGDPQNQYPVNYVQLPMLVVSSQIIPNGVGGTVTNKYYYEDAAIHRQGKGFLGFRKVKSVNTEYGGTTAITENEINTQFAVPYTVKQTIELTGQYPNPNELLSESFVTNSFVNLSTGSQDIRYFQKIDKTLQIDHLNGTATQTDHNYDNYGNITSSVQQVGYIPAGGNTITATETETTNTTYGWFNTSVPAHPVTITTTKLRNNQPTVNSAVNYSYNAIGLPITKTEFYGLPKAVTVNYSYNGFGNLVQTITSATGLNNRVASMVFDTKGRFPLSKEVVSTNNVIQKETFIYDGKWGQPVSKSDVNCLVAGFEFDAFGRVKKTTMPEGYSVNSTLNWDVLGEQVYYSFTDFPGGKPDSKTWFDKMGRDIRSQAAGFNNQWLTQVNTYDERGQLSAKTNTFYAGETPITTFNTYDDYGRPYTVTNPLSSVSYSYTKLSEGKRKVTIQNSAGQTSSKTSDAAGKTISATDNGGTLSFVYDSRGNQLQTLHGNTIMVSNEYDAYGRQTSLTDKNAGTIYYQYDAFGQLVQQTDANGNAYTMAYDDFGRITGRQGPEGNTTYEYYAKGIVRGFCLNKLRKVTGFNGVTKEYTYDALKRPQAETVTVDGTAFVTQFGYDGYSNLISTTYPSGVVVTNTYDNSGNLLTVAGGDAWNPVTLFIAGAVNGNGQYTNYTLGNGKTSQFTYNYGLPVRLYTPGVQDMQYSFDLATANLNSRYDALKNLAETFQYDNLDRLTTCTVNGVQQLNINYDGNSSSSLGNIISKTDAGNYVYNNSKVHAVAYITNPAGPAAPPVTMLPSPDQQINYTQFLKAASVSDGAVQTNFMYSPDYQRIKTVETISGQINNTKYYIGNMERVTNSGYTRDIHFIPVGNSIAIIEKPLNWNSTIHFIYTDYLGSLLTRTDVNGTVTAEQNFDAWGRQRNPANWQYQSYSFISSEFFGRGFTGHEHLPYHGLINMNGRLYDPVQGRMLSPDNYVPDPWHTQGYNRYGYANNNPLKFTDPDGNFLVPILVGALIGASTSAAIYSISTMITGNKWTWSGFTRSVAMGALSGALGGGFSVLGKSLGAFGQSISYGMMTNMVSTATVNAAFGNKTTFGSMAGAAFGGLIDGAIPQFKGFKFNGKFGFWKGMLNGFSELGINTVRGGFIGGLSNSMGAMIDGGDPREAFGQGFRNGAIGAGVRTALNITVLGPAIRPSGNSEIALMAMERDLGISLLSGSGSPVYRTGGIWQRGLTTGRSLLVGTGTESNDDINTWVHESFHYFQQIRQTWAGQAGRGMYEQWILPILGRNPYYTPGTNEVKAFFYTQQYYPINW